MQRTSPNHNTSRPNSPNPGGLRARGLPGRSRAGCTVLLLLLLSVALQSAAPTARAEEPTPMLPSGMHEGTGTQFLLDCGSFTLAIETSVPVTLALDALSPAALNLHIRSGVETDSALVTISGLPAVITLYRYEDALLDPTVSETSASGAYTFLQDLSRPHLVMIRPSPATISLTSSGWSVPGVGTWDPTTSAATLTTDVSETIQIYGYSGPPLTLDGAGHSINIGPSFYGVLVGFSSNVTIKNITVTDAYDAIIAYNSSNIVIRDNTLRAERLCSYVRDSDNLQIIGNSMTSYGSGSPRGDGIYVTNVASGLIADNTIEAPAGMGISLDETSSFTVSGNEITTHLYALALSWDVSSVICSNSCSSDLSCFQAYGSTNDLVYSNNFVSLGGKAPVVLTGSGNVYHRPAPVGGNYWNTYTGVDSNGDGFGDTPYVLSATYGFRDELPLITLFGQEPPPPPVAVSGVVSCDCEAALAGVVVTLAHPSGTFEALTGAEGSFSFEVPRVAGEIGSLSVSVPAGFTPGAPPAGSIAISFEEDTTQDFALACIYVTVSGSVAAECLGVLPLVQVHLMHAGGTQTVLTEADGSFSFAGIRYSESTAEISIVAPLGFAVISPASGCATVALTHDTSGVDFTLECLDTTGRPRSRAYWKQQAHVHLRGRGHATESYEDMAVNFPAAIYNHFYANELSSIAVPGVTYIPDDTSGVPLDLAAIHTTLKVLGKGRLTMLDQAKGQYLALLLNVASGKLRTFTVVSRDGGTASQALQQIAAMILDGNRCNDNRARKIAKTINKGRLLPAGVLDLGTVYVPFGASPSSDPPPPDVFSLSQNSPNPVKTQTTITLSLPTASAYELAIFNVEGRLLRQYTETAGPGVTRIVWDGSDQHGYRLPSGTYLYRLTAGDSRQTKKLLIMR